MNQKLDRKSGRRPLSHDAIQHHGVATQSLGHTAGAGQGQAMGE